MRGCYDPCESDGREQQDAESAGFAPWDESEEKCRHTNDATEGDIEQLEQWLAVEGVVVVRKHHAKLSRGNARIIQAQRGVLGGAAVAQEPVVDGAGRQAEDGG